MGHVSRTPGVPGDDLAGRVLSTEKNREPRPLRVLLIEDSEEDAFLLLRELERGGYAPEHGRVFTEKGMREALDRGGWDIVVCDHSMPTFDSSAALGVLQERGPLDVPFVIVSGNIDEEAAVAAMRLGAHDYFMKSNLARLNTAVDRELREAENRRERRRAQGALRRSEERYRTFVAQITEGIWRAELEEPVDTTLPATEQVEAIYLQLRFAEANDALANMYGLRRGEDLVGKRLEDFMPRDDKRNAGIILDGIRNGYRVTDSESSGRDRQGRVRHFLNNFVGIVEDGRLKRVWGTRRDVTARREAEKKYRDIFENAVEGIYQSTASGKLLTVNPAMAKIFGYGSPEQMLFEAEDTRTLYVDPEDRERFTVEVERSGAVTGYEIEVFRRDGSPAWVSLSGRAVIGEDGSLDGFEGTVEDVSDRRAAERALGEIREAERRRISRELHDGALQDLVFALGSIQVQRRLYGGRRAEEAKQMEALQRAVSGLRSAIYDLRTDEPDRQTLVRSLESVVALNRRTNGDCDISLNVSDGFPADMGGPTATEIVRIVQEALANVRRHSGARRAVVDLGHDGGGRVVVTVSDDGVGFPAESPAGIGLSGMRERAETLGGRLTVKSEEGRGTRITLAARLESEAADGTHGMEVR